MRQRYSAILMLVGVVGGLVLACSGDSTAPVAGEVGVHDDFFSPGTITRAVNSPVTWVWRGTRAHNVTFEDGNGSTTGDMTTGQHQRTFTVTGNYRYRCTIHSTDFTTGMVGQVIAVQSQ